MRTRTPVPFTLLRHDITTDADLGAALTPYEAAEFLFDHLTPRSICLASGWTVYRTSRESLRIPHMTADVGAEWVAEATAITPSDPDGDPIIATPRKLASLVEMSSETVTDSTPQALNTVGMSMGRALGLKADLGFLEGSGVAPVIRGLKNVSGISEVDMGTDGAAPTDLDPWIEAIGTLLENDAEATAIYMTPREWKSLMLLKEQSGSNVPLLTVIAGPDGKPRMAIQGVPVWTSTQMSVTETKGSNSDTSSSYVVQADQCVAVVRNEADIRVSGGRLFNSDQVEIRGTVRLDAVYPNPTAIVRVRGLRAA